MSVRIAYPWHLKERACGVGRWGGELRGRKVNACSKETERLFHPHRFCFDSWWGWGEWEEEEGKAHEDFCVSPLLGIYTEQLFTDVFLQVFSLLSCCLRRCFLLHTSLPLHPFHMSLTSLMLAHCPLSSSRAFCDLSPVQPLLSPSYEILQFS